MTRRPYVLGDDPRELDRLDLQGAFYADATRRAFVEAGLTPGMRVLDIGCGSGDVSLLAAELVGPTGHVVGIDRNAATVDGARARAAARGVAHASFLVAELDAPPHAAPFDALVGRFVLMHQPDAATTLARAAAAVRPGGVVALVESYMAALEHAPASDPPCPRFDHWVRWMCDLVRGGGADLDAGLRLRRTFLDAGLPAPELRMESRLEGGPDSPIYRYTAESVRSMTPMARRLGHDAPTAEQLDALADELRDEAVAAGAVLVGWPVVAAWCRVP